MRGSSSLSPHWSYHTSSLHIYDFLLLLPNSSVLLLSLCVFTTRCRSEQQNQCSLKAKIFLRPMYLFGYVNKLIEIYGSCFSRCTLSRVMFQEYHQLRTILQLGAGGADTKGQRYFNGSNIWLLMTNTVSPQFKIQIDPWGQLFLGERNTPLGLCSTHLLI